MKIKLITFTNNISDNITYFGFKIFSSKDANQFIKCVQRLEENNSEFDSGDIYLPWNQSDFEIQDISSNDCKLLYKLFDLDIKDETSNSIRNFSRCY